MYGSRDLRALCRQMGSPVSFAGVSTYADDGTPIKGLFDRPSQIRMMDSGIGGVEAPMPELRLPYNAFSPMPGSGDVVQVTDPDTAVTTSYTVETPTAEDDGALLCYELFRVTE